MHRPRILIIAALVSAWPLGGATPAVAQATFEGFVRDDAGNPVPDADLDFFDAQSGVRVDPSAPGFEGQSDATDFQGHYEMVVKLEVYHVRWEPPPARPDLAPRFIRNIIVGSDTVLDVTLPYGSRFTGRVTGPDGSPLEAVDLDLNDPLTGENPRIVDDETNASGEFSTTVPRGVWDITFEPPPGAGAGPFTHPSLDLRADTVFDVELPRGYTLSGRVLREGGPSVFNADLDLVRVDDGQKAPTSNDNSDAQGNLLAVAPEGAFHVLLTPPTGMPVAPHAIYDVDVDQDLDLGTIMLVNGVVLSGTASDAGGTPLADARVDLFQENSCDPYPATIRQTDASGGFTLRLEPGFYDVVISPASTELAPYRFSAIDATSSGTRDLQVPDETPQVVSITSRVVDAAGAGVAGAVVRAEPLQAGSAWEAVTAEDGSFTADAVRGSYSLEVTPPAGSRFEALQSVIDVPCGVAASFALAGVAVAPPPAGSRLRGFPNPSATSTSLLFNLAASEPSVRIDIYNALGRRVRTLQSGPLSGGANEIIWDGRNDRGRRVVTGLYLARLRSSRAELTTKIVRIRR